ncbi:hypothetical protein [Anaerosacchariphilus polymeriproducens]|uniref:Uncharacterized protein n=1 Tax=Anaerosacchariphilus polymeriproducens TaxID=1812858 RepID=A0A371AX40_9FIRM|nr:hypothetical protein [Anaerosacchariphilus polymeriproducens]RDU24146.1 hypothetical protein DWV06_05455 [Anaerosacchariphilus polymeriproducens]
MACRCVDIANCKDDITRLNTALKYLYELKNLDSEVESDLSSVARLCDNAFTTKNQNDLEKNVKEVRDDVANIIISVIMKITTEISNLENQTLVSLEAEDKKMHQEEKENESKN